MIAETARLRLRPFTPDDLPALIEIMADPTVPLLSPTGWTLTAEETTAMPGRILTAYERGGFGVWAVWNSRRRATG